MGIERKYDLGAIERGLRELPDKVGSLVVEKLCYAGESAVNKARKLPHPPESLWKTTNDKGETVVKSPVPAHQPNYIDWTANLRSSIGYVVVADGEIVQISSFEAVQGEKGNGEEGSQKGRQFAEELAGKYATGYALILVAGMHYAAYVQSKGYDVLNSAAIEAEEVAERLLVQLNSEIQEGVFNN